MPKPTRTQVNNAVLRQRLDELVEQHGGVRAVGRVLGVTGAYISRLRRGQKVWPDDSLLKKARSAANRDLLAIGRTAVEGGHRHMKVKLEMEGAAQ